MVAVKLKPLTPACLRCHFGLVGIVGELLCQLLVVPVLARCRGYRGRRDESEVDAVADEVAIDGVGHRAAKVDVVERRLLAVERGVEDAGARDGFPGELGLRDGRREVLGGAGADDVDLARAQVRELGGVVGDANDPDLLLRRFAEVIVRIGFQLDHHVGLEMGHPVRSRSLNLAEQRVEIVAGRNQPEVLGEVDEPTRLGLLQLDAHGVIVFGDHAREEGAEVSPALALLEVGLERVDHVLGRQRLAVVELDVIAQVEGVDGGIIADGRHLARNLGMHGTVRRGVDEIAVGQDRDHTEVVVAVIPWMKVWQRAEDRCGEKTVTTWIGGRQAWPAGREADGAGTHELEGRATIEMFGKHVVLPLNWPSRGAPQRQGNSSKWRG